MRCSLLVLIWTVMSSMNYAHKIDSVDNLIDDENGLTQDGRRLVADGGVSAWVILSAISATTTATKAVTDVLASSINAYGAKIRVSNHFKYVDLHRSQWKVVEGEQIGTVEQVVFRRKEGAGGVFSDESFTVDGSAGIVQYKAMNPITQKEYCFEYLWSIDAYAINIKTYHSGNNIVVPQNNLLSGMAIVISSGSESRCSKDITVAFNDIKKLWIEKVKSNAGENWFMSGINWNFKFEDSWSTNVMLAFESKDTQDGLRISSSDLRVAMSATMTNSDKTEMQITIGPYKQVFGTLYGNWQILVPGQTCTDPYEWLGKYDNVNECHNACVKTKKTSCKYFVFGTDSKYGNCYWENGCTTFESALYVTISNVETDIELFEIGHECDSGKELDLGNFTTIDECAAACKREKGTDCIFFDFGHTGTRMGMCWWEESCTSTAEYPTYNIYVIKSGAINLFDESKSVNSRYIAIDSPVVHNNKVKNWSIYGIPFNMFIVLLLSIVVIGIVYNVYCCVVISKETKSDENANINDKP
eukprot:35126_1